MSSDLIWILGGILLAILLDLYLVRYRRLLPVYTWLKRAVVPEVTSQPLAVTLFSLGSVVYALTRFIGLDKFPIYFFCDEAAQTVLAADFVSNGFRDSLGHFLPTFFKNVYYSLGTTVYFQAVPYLLFGKSVIVTRGASALISLFGAVAVGLTLKNVFKARWWWAGVLLLSIIPAWFLHSRTAFETVTMVSLYAWFLYFYSLYRYRDPRYVFPALLFGALAFYSYKPGQVVIVFTGLLLVISDWRYHWANRRMGWRVGAFLGLLVLPYVRFGIEHPGDIYSHLRSIDSYWLKSWPLSQKIGQFWKEYTLGLDPRYWYWPVNTRDLPRHMMKGYGHILLATLPLAALGLAMCLRHIRSAAHRMLLIALLAAPAGGAIAAIGVTRVLVLVIPAVLLTALGLETLQAWVARRFSTSWLAVGVFVLLGVANFGMLQDALVNGPTWYTNYGLYGMQYGAQEIFAEIRAYLRQSPDTRVRLSPAWANGTDYLLRFFMNDDPRVRLDSVESYLYRRQPLSDDMLFIMTPDEYRKAQASPKLTDVRLERTLPYPDGQDGFFFTHFRYSSAADALFVRPELVTASITLDGQAVQVHHSSFEAGRLQDMFDRDPLTLVRMEEANPAIIELAFPMPRAVRGVLVTVGSMDVGLTAFLYADENGDPVIYSRNYTGLPPDPTVKLDWELSQVIKMRLEIQALGRSGKVKIHIREIVIQ